MGFGVRRVRVGVRAKVRVSGFGCGIECFGFRVSGFGFRVSGFGFRVSGFGFQNTTANPNLTLIINPKPKT